MRKLFTLFVFVLILNFTYAQNVTISGYVEDASTGERIIGAAIYETNFSKYGTFTNEYGFFSLTLPKGKYHLKVSYVGYKPLDTTLDIEVSKQITFKLHSATELEQVVVTSYKNEIQSSQTGRIRVPLKQIKSLPVIFGEQDLLKALQLLPGVKGGVEGSSGIFVRGGSPDQNLILLDGVPVYSLSHMGGMFSIFTPEAIKEVTLYKSGFPARFGGRLSSVIDVRMKDGNMKKLTGSTSIGLISSKATIEGPIIKNKSSFIISFRRTYYDLIARPFIRKLGSTNSEQNGPNFYSKTNDKTDAGYFFYDFYAKANYKINSKNRIYLSIYAGNDKLFVKNSTYNLSIEKSTSDTSIYNSSSKFTTAWGNQIVAFRWNRALTDKMFVNTTLTYSRFSLGMRDDYFDYNYDSPSRSSVNSQGYNNYDLFVQDLALNNDFTFQPTDNHYVRFGVQGIYHTFLPGELSYGVTDQYDSVKTSIDTAYGYQRLYAPEGAAYFEDNVKIGSKVRMNLGMRVSMFRIRGKTFHSIEPRISGSYKFSDKLSVKLSYAQMTQYLHLLPNNTFLLPLDMWLPATDKVIPEFSQQIAGGVWWLLPNNLTVSLEGYYKKMQHLIEYKEGKSWFSFFEQQQSVVDSWENMVTQGSGYAYGADLLVRKDFGKLTGWLAYSLSWSMRRFDEINFGKPFPFKYDTRHDFSLALNYRQSERFDFGLVWVFTSGRPITLPLGQMFNPVNLYSDVTYNYLQNGSYVVTPSGVYYYGGRNQYRLPPYHRLDLSFNFKKRKKHGIRTWTFGVYNVYNHVNPVFAFVYNDSWGDGDSRPNYVLRIISIFQVMPFVTYTFNWN